MTTTAQDILVPAPGFYRDIDFDTYVSWDAANQSILHEFRRTPAHAWHKLISGGGDRTPSKDLGWLFHLAVMEPERFEHDVVTAPKIKDKRTKAGKAQWAEFQAENREKTVVDAADLSKVLAMRRSLLEHPTAREFFSGRGSNEASILWNERETGEACKARIDRVGAINEWPIVGDLKSTKDASRRDFERSIYFYGYHVQAAHYLDGLETLVPVPAGNPFRRYLFFVTENVPPFCTAVYELDDSAITEGKTRRDLYLRSWAECRRTGNWPGYPDGVDYVSLPAWAFKSYID